MKKILKWTGISLLLIIVLIILLPFIFKDKIIQTVKDEANKSLNAKVDFGDFDISLISYFYTQVRFLIIGFFYLKIKYYLTKLL